MGCVLAIGSNLDAVQDRRVFDRGAGRCIAEASGVYLQTQATGASMTDDRRRSAQILRPLSLAASLAACAATPAPTPERPAPHGAPPGLAMPQRAGNVR